MAFLGHHFVVKFTNDSVNPTNYALCDIDLRPTYAGTVAVANAQIQAYFAGQGTEAMAAGTKIQEVLYYAPGTNLGVLLPFPAAEYAVIHTAFAGLPNLTAYGQNIGRTGENLAPLGTSIVVTEYTAVGGPAGRGRHYLPFISENLVGTDGFVASTALAPMKNNWEQFIRDNPNDTATIDLQPTVINAAQSTSTPITVVKVQPVFSNLRSRRR